MPEYHHLRNDYLQCDQPNARTPAHISHRLHAGTPVTADASRNTASATRRGTGLFVCSMSCTTAASALKSPVSRKTIVRRGTEARSVGNPAGTVNVWPATSD
jgi:hypothetical protein